MAANINPLPATQVPAPAPSPPPSTVHPGSSVSQTKSKRSRKGKKSRTQATDTSVTVPTGSIPVPPPGQSPPVNPTKPTSETVPITGWGSSDIASMQKRVPLLSYTPDASGFFGLVDEVYSELYATRASQVKTLPRSLFRYFCGMSWWYRVLFVQRQNGFHLSTQQKEFVTVFESLPLSLPDKVAQYLANLGNFLYNGEEYRMKLPDFEFSSTLSDDKPWATGFLHTSGTAHRVVDAESFWVYAQIPVPGVLPLSVCNELRTATQPLGVGYDLNELAPETPNAKPVSTSNIVGFDYKGLVPYHSSWAARLRNLGFGLDSYPSDMQTDLMVSPSVLLAVSDALSSVSNYKLVPSKQLVLSRMGSFFQYSFLETLDYLQDMTPPTARNAYSFSALLRSEFHLAARSLVPAQLTTPLVCFGYQVKRYLVPDHPLQTLFSPWLYYKVELEVEEGRVRTVDTNDVADLPPDLLRGMNVPLQSLDVDLRVARYYTNSLVRSVVLSTSVFAK